MYLILVAVTVVMVMWMVVVMAMDYCCVISGSHFQIVLKTVKHKHKQNSTTVTAHQAKQLRGTTKEKKQDQVNHLGLGSSVWTKRLKSHEL